MKDVYPRRLYLDILVLLLAGASSAHAFTEGNYTYTVAEGQATITGFNTSYAGPLTIPSSLGGNPVIDIAACAFYKCCNVTRITIPGGVGRIGASAFTGCSKVTRVDIPDSVTNIGSGCFSDCSSVTNVVIPCNVTWIGSRAFANCRSLSVALFRGNAPASGDTPFGAAPATVYFMQGTSGWDTTFAGRPTAMLSFTYTVDNGGATITGFTRSYPGPLPIPDTLDGYLVTCIGDMAFSSCNLTDVTIPSGVTNVGNYAFAAALVTSVSFPDTLTRIGECVFGHCDGLTHVSVPNGVTDLGREVFYGCRALTDIAIGSSVTNIGNAAFKNCWALERITLPSHIGSLGYQAFADCYALTSVFFTGNAPLSVGGSLFSNSGSLTVYYLPEATGWGDSFVDRPAVCWAPAVLNDATFGFTGQGAFSFNIASTSEIPVIVQTSAAPAAGAWTTLTNATLNGRDALTFTDPAAAGHPARFYRIAWP